ncbi:DHH family phosphoesterase, partial [Geminocystis sp. GBBB08]|uniref:DHH family phosphoesterase n=1 Tax=Geminocystis sp. GBBB08 TaxID=2604140 RepID=UPI0027E2FDB7
MKTEWKIAQNNDIPEWFFREVNYLTNKNNSDYLAPLLWGRGIRDSQQLNWFLETNNYQSPSFISEFGWEIKQALTRLETAWNQREKIAIWGGYNLDGVTATCVLWEGLKLFFPLENQLIYHLPDSLNDSHSLKSHGIDFLQQQGISLLITADMGSNNSSEINYANSLGIDIIIIDHHSLPDDRPKVISFLNPLNFAENHPFYHLSGVAIAYKLLEALSQKFSSLSSQPIRNLLDLVAIGLLVDATPLKGDCRYLAREGIKILKETKRSAIAILVQLCQDNGDRAMDISLGIAQRINAINYIENSTNFIFQLLTTKDEKLGEDLANKVEKAHFNVKELQKKILNQVKKKIQNLDISNIGVILVSDSQWEVKILPLITNIISQEYNRPTIFLSIDNDSMIAKGYGCGIKNIDLAELLTNKQELLHRLIHYHDTIELSLPVENIALLRDNLNQQIRSKISFDSLQPIINIDLIITVAELGQNLRHELRLIEPSSVDNPNPKLLIKNCWFKILRNTNKSYNSKIKQGQYIQTYFTIFDQTSPDKGFNGIWLGHYSSDINLNCYYDVVVELDYNCAEKKYYIRIIDLKFSQEKSNYYNTIKPSPSIIDHRYQTTLLSTNNDDILLDKCPFQWQEITHNYQNAMASKKNLVLAYNHNNQKNSQELWQKFIGIVKHLIQEDKTREIKQILEEIDMSELGLKAILNSLEKIGIIYENRENRIKFKQLCPTFSTEIYQEIKQQFQDI